MAVSFDVGDTFSSYEEFESRIEEFEKLNFVQFTHRDSRTLKSAAKRVPRVVEKANKELVYYSIVLSCVHGGKKHKSEGSGVRPIQKLVYDCQLVFNCIKLQLHVQVIGARTCKIGTSYTLLNIMQ